MKKTAIPKKNDAISKYSMVQNKKYAAICNALRSEIDTALNTATSRIFYAMPVWFIKDNPIVGYKVTSKYVNLMFWSGRDFAEPDLLSAGKFKAAQIKYQSFSDINVKDLRRWLIKAKNNIWDYKNIRTNFKKI